MTLTRRELLKRASVMTGAAALVAACGPDPVPPELTLPTAPPPPSGPRTIVVIIGDDMRFDYRRVLRNLDASWVDCVNAAVEVPMCGPSRAALFKGMYSKRTGVTGNANTYLMSDADTIATRIRSRGFRTVLSGKYLNDFPWTRPASYVPPGWDVWNAAGSSSFQPGAMWSSDYVFHVRRAAGVEHGGVDAHVPVGRADRSPPPGRPPAALRQHQRRAATQGAERSTRPTSATSRSTSSTGS